MPGQSTTPSRPEHPDTPDHDGADGRPGRRPRTLVRIARRWRAAQERFARMPRPTVEDARAFQAVTALTLSFTKTGDDPHPDQVAAIAYGIPRDEVASWHRKRTREALGRLAAHGVVEYSADRGPGALWRIILPPASDEPDPWQGCDSSSNGTPGRGPTPQKGTPSRHERDPQQARKGPLGPRGNPYGERASESPEEEPRKNPRRETRARDDDDDDETADAIDPEGDPEGRSDRDPGGLASRLAFALRANRSPQTNAELREESSAAVRRALGVEGLAPDVVAKLIDQAAGAGAQYVSDFAKLARAEGAEAAPSSAGAAREPSVAFCETCGEVRWMPGHGPTPCACPATDEAAP